MSDEVTAAIIAVILGAAVGVIGERLRQRHKLIEYEVQFMPLLRFRPTTTHSVTVTVDKAMLTGNDADRGTTVTVSSVYGFQVELFNAGNEDVNQPQFEITLDKNAKIIEYATEPESSNAYEIDINYDANKPNNLLVKVPHLNRGDSMLIRLISVENTTPACKVNPIGYGLGNRPRSLNRELLYALVWLIPFFAYAVFISSGANWLSPSIINDLGATIETRKVLRFPFQVEAVIYLVIFIPFLVGMLILYTTVTIQNIQRRYGWDWRRPSNRRLLQKLQFFIRYMLESLEEEYKRIRGSQ